VNCDVALDSHNGQMGTGIIIQNHEGGMHAARSVTINGFTDPTTAEALASFCVVKFYQEDHC
jgi:hypothetical protein